MILSNRAIPDALAFGSPSLHASGMPRNGIKTAPEAIRSSSKYTSFNCIDYTWSGAFRSDFYPEAPGKAFRNVSGPAYQYRMKLYAADHTTSVPFRNHSGITRPVLPDCNFRNILCYFLPSKTSKYYHHVSKCYFYSNKSLPYFVELPSTV